MNKSRGGEMISIVLLAVAVTVVGIIFLDYSKGSKDTELSDELRQMRAKVIAQETSLADARGDVDNLKLAMGDLNERQSNSDKERARQYEWLDGKITAIEKRPVPDAPVATPLFPNTIHLVMEPGKGPLKLYYKDFDKRKVVSKMPVLDKVKKQIKELSK